MKSFKQIEEGRPSQRHPLEGHEYHKKSNGALIGIAKDAHKAAEAMKSHNTTAENKYRDQANDSATVRYFRQKNGMPDWYKKKYGHMKEETMSEAKEKTEYDYEGDMARGQLQSIISNAQRVHDMLEDNDNIAEWVQSKITLAEDYISTVANYMMSEVDEQFNPTRHTVEKDSPPSKDKVASANKQYADMAAARKKKLSQGADFAAQRRKERLASNGRMDEGKDPLPRETTKDGGSFVRSGKTATHYSGKKTYEYRKFDKEGKETGERHYRDAQGNHMGEAVEPPFTPNKPKTSALPGKSGIGYSTARHLARMAMQKQVDKLKKPVKESIEESRKAQIVKDIVKKKKVATEDTFQKDPELSSSLTKTE